MLSLSDNQLHRLDPQAFRPLGNLKGWNLFLLKYVDMILNSFYVCLDRCSKERSSWNVDGWSNNCGFSAWHDFELFVCLSWLLFIRKKFLKWQSAEVEITIKVFQLEIVPKPVALWLQARDVLALGKEYLFFLQLSFLLVLGKIFFQLSSKSWITFLCL